MEKVPYKYIYIKYIKCNQWKYKNNTTISNARDGCTFIIQIHPMQAMDHHRPIGSHSKGFRGARFRRLNCTAVDKSACLYEIERGAQSRYCSALGVFNRNVALFVVVAVSGGERGQHTSRCKYTLNLKSKLKSTM